MFFGTLHEIRRVINSVSKVKSIVTFFRNFDFCSNTKIKFITEFIKFLSFLQIYHLFKAAMGCSFL